MEISESAWLVCPNRPGRAGFGRTDGRGNPRGRSEDLVQEENQRKTTLLKFYIDTQKSLTRKDMHFPNIILGVYVKFQGCGRWFQTILFLP